MTNYSQAYPIEDPNELRRIAAEICQNMKGTDDAPAMAMSAIADYPPLYAAALGIMIAKLSATPGDVDSNEWMAKFLMALAQDRVRSVFYRSGEPHWPEWMEDESEGARLTTELATTSNRRSGSVGKSTVDGSCILPRSQNFDLLLKCFEIGFAIY